MYNKKIIFFVSAIVNMLCLSANASEPVAGEMIKRQDNIPYIEVEPKRNLTDVMPTTPATEEEPDIELNHLEAMAFLFGTYSPLRNRIGTAERAWFPLPIYSYSVDNV